MALNFLIVLYAEPIHRTSGRIHALPCLTPLAVLYNDGAESVNAAHRSCASDRGECPSPKSADRTFSAPPESHELRYLDPTDHWYIDMNVCTAECEWPCSRPEES